VRWTATGWQQPPSPNGILPTLHSLFTGDLDAVWATAAVVDGDSGMTRLDGHGMSLPLAFLPLTHAEWAGYFHHAGKETLWPVLMSQLQRLRFDPATWAHYQAVNARFADHISAHAAPGATVWLSYMERAISSGRPAPIESGTKRGTNGGRVGVPSP
jgi:trehalose-6-phosphate synthase